jgi:3-hydroxy-9,10-secoandrosta-1,3,5(10)-triene-9,17-dione monooxygenase
LYRVCVPWRDADRRAVTPTLEQMVERAESLLPRLRDRAQQAEALRRAPDETIQDFRDAGLFRVLQPARWGGYEMHYGRTQTELCSVLGRACGSSAWVQSVIACHAWCVAMCPEAAQDAVWGRNPDTLVASAFQSSTGAGRIVEGGYRVGGTWQFSSGSDACEWVILQVPIMGEATGGPPLKRVWCLVRRPDWQVVDTWFAAGLKGTGSNDIQVADTLVPFEHTADIDEFDGRPTPGSRVNTWYTYRLPLFSVFPYNVSTPALGIARGALEAFVEYTTSRPERANMAQRHMRIAESAAEIDAAQAVWLSDAATIERLGQTFGPWPPVLLARLRRDLAYATLLCTRAVDRLAMAVGAHGMLEDTPIQRAFRDVHAVANHAANNWDLQAVPFARELLGLPPLPMR